jgi:ABC-type glucose/galactose transport system permease subunit
MAGVKYHLQWIIKGLLLLEAMAICSVRWNSES